MLETLIPSKGLIIDAVLSSFLGAIVFYALVFSGQRWAANYNFMLTCFLLPLISFIITKAISGNIALSLGMVGALSIVRFRHPVKSPFELSIFFLLVTLGISINSSKSGSIALILVFVSIVFLQNVRCNNPSKISLIPTGFSRTTSEEIFVLEIQTSNSLEQAYNCRELILSDSNLENSSFRYKFSFGSLEELNTFLDIVKNTNQIKNVQISKLT